MGNYFRDLIAGMLGARDGMLPSIQAFPPLDLEQLARNLRLDERAQEAGRMGQPRAEASEPDLPEFEIRHEMEHRARKANEDYVSQRDLYDARVRRAVLSGEGRVQIEAAGQNTLADFKAEIINDQNQLHTLEREVQGREKEFNAFRKQHGLDRLPRAKTPRERLLAILILVIIVILESGLNGMFFAEGSEAGIIGGVTQAFVLSLLNVTAAVFYSRYALPRLAHRSPASKMVGILGTMGFLLWLIGLNLAIGHFRDLFIRGSGQVDLAELWNALTSSPLLLSDAKSMLLVLLGITLGTVAALDVASMRDLYPGFEAVGHYHRRAIQEYADANGRCLTALMHLRSQSVDDMAEAIALIRGSKYEMQLAIEGRTRLHQHFVAYLDHLADVHGLLIRRYREANRRARTSATPKYFDSPPERPSFLLPSSLPPLPDLEEEARQAVLGRIDHYIKAVNEKFEEALPAYKTVDQLTTGETR